MEERQDAEDAIAFAQSEDLFELFDVGLYEGTTAPTFVVPDYPSELALCQRYYAKTGFDLEMPVTSGQDYGISAQFPVPMRAIPALTAADTSSTNLSTPTALSTVSGSTNTVAYRKRASATGPGVLASILTGNARL